MIITRCRATLGVFYFELIDIRQVVCDMEWQCVSVSVFVVSIGSVEAQTVCIFPRLL